MVKLFSREWNKEIARAQRKKREPKLRNAMFRLFAPNVILDGLLVFLFVLVRCLLPLVLGQLLLQFQKPIVMESMVALQTNKTTIATNSSDTNSTIPVHRSSRSIPDYSQLRGGNLDGLNDENEKGYYHFKAFAEHSSGML